MNVVINGLQPLTYTSVKQPLPLGVVLYFPNTRLNVSQTDVQSTGNPIASIHAGQIEAKTNTTRIEILLASDVPYNVVQDGDSLKIQFQKLNSASKGDSNDSATQSSPALQPTATNESQPIQFARTLMKDARRGNSIVSRVQLLPRKLVRLSRRGSNPLHINAGSASVIL